MSGLSLIRAEATSREAELTALVLNGVTSPHTDAFPSLMQLGQHRKEEITEMAGTSYQEAIEVPTVALRLTPRVEMDLAPATVILNATGEYKFDGNFGFDLLDKALPVTIDFRAMRMSFP